MARTRSFRLLRWIFSAALLVVVLILCCGTGLLIADRPPDRHVDAAVVLQGSVVAEKVRTAAGMKFLQQGVADRMLLSVPKESYWGQSLPPIARAYLERTFGAALASRVDFCETGGEVNSTVEEMRALSPCIKDHHWHSIVLVTSTYHTRRAGMIWKKLSKENPDMQIYIQSVQDPEFQLPWWRHRQSAKIFFMESIKLVWTTLGG